MHTRTKTQTYTPLDLARTNEYDEASKTSRELLHVPHYTASTCPCHPTSTTQGYSHTGGEGEGQPGRLIVNDHPAGVAAYSSHPPRFSSRPRTAPSLPLPSPASSKPRSTARTPERTTSITSGPHPRSTTRTPERAHPGATHPVPRSSARTPERRNPILRPQHPRSTARTPERHTQRLPSMPNAHSSSTAACAADRNPQPSAAHHPSRPLRATSPPQASPQRPFDRQLSRQHSQHAQQQQQQQRHTPLTHHAPQAPPLPSEGCTPQQRHHQGSSPEHKPSNVSLHKHSSSSPTAFTPFAWQLEGGTPASTPFGPPPPAGLGKAVEDARDPSTAPLQEGGAYKGEEDEDEEDPFTMPSFAGRS